MTHDRERAPADAPGGPRNPFDVFKAPVAHFVADDLRDAWYGNYGCSWGSLVDTVACHDPGHPDPERAVLGAWPHVVKAFLEQGFVVVQGAQVPVEYRLARKP